LGRVLPWAGLLLGVFLFRLPGFAFGILNVDETDFYLCARRMVEGGLPYVDVYNDKPVLVFLPYLVGAAFGFHMWPVRVVAGLWLFATCAVLKQAAFIWTGRSAVGWAAAVLGLLATCCDVPSVSAELLMNLPIAGALFFFIRAQKEDRISDQAWCGLSIGLASLFKQQAGLVLISLSLAHLLSGFEPTAQRRANGARLARLWIGFAAPWAAAGLAYALLGHWRDFFEWNVERTFLYFNRGAGSVLQRLAISLGECILGTTPLIWWLAARESAGQRELIRFGLALTLWLTWIPVSLGGRFYEHYFLQFAPSLALLAAPGLVALWDRRRALTRWRSIALALALALPPIASLTVAFGLGVVGHYPSENPKANQIASWLSAHTAPSERVFIWGYFPPIYFLAQRMPATRYLHLGPLFGNFDPHHLQPGFDAAAHASARDVSRTLQDLEAHQPAVIVDTAPADIHDWAKIPLEKFPWLARYVEDKYRLVDWSGGAAIYQRR